MKILVLLFGAAMAIGASRPPPSLYARYFDSSPYFERPLIHLGSSFPSRNLKHEPFFQHTSSINLKDDIIRDGPPYNYQKKQNFFDFSTAASPYLSSHELPSFYDEPSSHSNVEKFNAQDYKGPPPPISKQNSQDQIIFHQNDRLNHSFEIPVIKFLKNQTSPQHMTNEQSQRLLITDNINSIDYRNHGLGFGSMIGVTSADINPIALAESMPSTKTPVAMQSTVSLESAKTDRVNVSQQQQIKYQHNRPTNALNSGTLTTVLSKTPAVEFKSTQVSPSPNFVTNDITTTPSTLKITSVMPDAKIASIKNPSSQAPVVTMILGPETPKPHDFRMISEELPLKSHGQQSIELSEEKLHVPDVKKNVLLYEPKNNFPFQPSHLYVEQKQHMSELTTPLKFSIPTAMSLSTTPRHFTTPVKLVYQNLDLSGSTLPLMSGSNSNTYSPQHSQIDATHFGKLNSDNNLGHNPYMYTPHENQLRLMQLGKLISPNNLGSNVYTYVPQQSELDLTDFKKLGYFAGSNSNIPQLSPIDLAHFEQLNSTNNLGSNSFPHISEHNQLDLATFGHLYSEKNLKSRTPSYSFEQQHSKHSKPSNYISQEMSLGLFDLTPNNDNAKDNTGLNFEISLSNLGEKEYIQSESNFVPSRSALLRLEKPNEHVYHPFTVLDSAFANIVLN